MILVRHGESAFNVVYGATRRDPGIEDPELTTNGEEQAHRAGRRLAELGIERLIVSPYTRALQTAERVETYLSAEIEIDPLVRERCAFSCDLGTVGSELARRWPRHRFEHVEENWWGEIEESEASVKRRSDIFRDRIAEAGNWQRIAVVTHWGFIRALTGIEAANGALVRFDPAREAQPGELVPAVET